MNESSGCEDNELEEEVDVLREIYISELDISRDANKRVESVSLQVHPATGDRDDQKWVCLTLDLRPDADYPHSIPEIRIRNPRGLAEQHVITLHQELHDLAESRVGECMLFELIEYAKESITEGNKPHGECAICRDGFSDDDTFTKTKCYHYFHCDCMLSYVEYSEKENEDDYKSQMEAAPHLKASLKPVVCPVCREPITYDIGFLQSNPKREDLLKSDIVLGPEVRQLQQKMSKLFKVQQAKGGIIDLEEEKNKFLLSVMMSSAGTVNSDVASDENSNAVGLSNEGNDQTEQSHSARSTLSTKDGDDKESPAQRKQAEGDYKLEQNSKSAGKEPYQEHSHGSTVNASSETTSTRHGKTASDQRAGKSKYKDRPYRDQRPRGQRHQGSENWRRDTQNVERNNDRPMAREDEESRPSHPRDCEHESQGNRQQWRGERNHHRRDNHRRQHQSYQPKTDSTVKNEPQERCQFPSDISKEDQTTSHDRVSGLSHETGASTSRRHPSMQERSQQEGADVKAPSPNESTNGSDTHIKSTSVRDEKSGVRRNFGERRQNQRLQSDRRHGQNDSGESRSKGGNKSEFSNHQQPRRNQPRGHHRHQINGHGRERMERRNEERIDDQLNARSCNDVEIASEVIGSKDNHSCTGGSHKGTSRKPRYNRTYSRGGRREHERSSEELWDLDDDPSGPGSESHGTVRRHQDRSSSSQSHHKNGRSGSSHQDQSSSSQSHHKNRRHRKPRPNPRQSEQSQVPQASLKEEVWDLDDRLPPQIVANS